MNDIALMSSPLLELAKENPYLPSNERLLVWQRQALKQFMQQGFPARKQERWKYTDLSYLEETTMIWADKATAHSVEPTLSNAIKIVFINGYFSAAHSDLQQVPAGVILCPLSEALRMHTELVMPYLTQTVKEYPLANLNAALLTEGVFLFVPKSIAITMPIHCLFINTQAEDTVIHPRNIVIANANSKVSWLEEYRSSATTSYFTNAVTMVSADRHAHVHFHKLQAEGPQATHISHVLVTQQQDSAVTCFDASIGARLARTDLHVNLQARGAECHLNGFYQLTADNQHIDHHLHVDHVAEHGASTMLYKGTLDKKSRAIFNGKVLVHKNAQRITAQQGNHNLLLSPNAEVDTKPELEIYADDVKCAHGATIGQLDADALFYLRARGIEQAQAQTLLTRAFVEDVFRKVEQADIKSYLEQQVGHHHE